MQQIESRRGSPRVVGVPPAAGRILAPETGSIAVTERAVSVRPWPAMYGSPVSTGSRLEVTAVGDTPVSHHSYTPVSAAGGNGAADHPVHTLHRQDSGAKLMEGHSDGTARIQERTTDNQSVNRDVAQQSDTLHRVAEHLTANITQSSSLYGLSFEELEDAIDEIITEDGFIPFVSWRPISHRLLS